jgi:Ca2+-binding RTX toxin-like protein
VSRRRSGPVALVALSLLAVASPVFAAPPPNDAFAAAQVVPSLPFEHALSTTEATTEPSEPEPPCTGFIERTVWYSFTPASDEVIGVDTRGSDFDTIVSVYTGSSLSELTPVACSDDETTLQARVVFAAEGGRTYYIQAGGYEGGNLRIAFREVDAGTIAGTVTEEGTGVPLRSICVSAIDADFGNVNFTVTDAQGRYRLPVREGDYFVVFEDFCDRSNDHRSEWYDNVQREEQASRITVSTGAVVGGIDAALARTCSGFGDSDMPQVIGTDGADVLVGTAEDEVICGLDGRDRIRAGGGRDVVDGGGGRDRLAGNGGRDRVAGADGRDRISAGGGNDFADGDRGHDVVAGGSRNDHLHGGGGNDVLRGGPGTDRCHADGGDKDRAAPSCERLRDVP